MKTLFTAFKGVHNTSFHLVDRLGGDSVFFTNSLQGLEKDISSIHCDYRAVYMFGVDKALIDKVRIETCACYHEETRNTDFDIRSLEKRLRNGNISYTVSDKPTHFLCNAAYYHMLKINLNTVFIHIPSVKGMTAAMMDKLVTVFSKDDLLQE